MVSVATMADVAAIEQVSLSERDLPANTYEAIRRGAALNPDGVALHFFLQGDSYDKGVSYTYREWVGALHQTANMFHALGLRPGEVVTMILPNLPQAFLTILGGEMAGIVGPINPMLDPAGLADIMNAAQSKMLVTLAPFPGVDIWEKAVSVVEQTPTVETVAVVDLADFIPGLPKPELPEIIAQARVVDFNAEMQKQPSDRLIFERAIKPDDIASYFHTGGTTGAPKIARHTHRNEVMDAWSPGVVLEVEPGQVFMCGLPLYHVNAVVVTGMIPWMYGATVLLATPMGYRDKTLFPNFWKIVEHYKVTFFSGVPTVYAGLLHVPIGDSDVSSLRYAICGAAPMPVEVFKEFERRTGIRILEGYGLTEGTCVSSVNPPHGERRIGSIGFRIPYQEMIIARVDEDGSGAALPANEIGSVLIRGDNVFPGYLEDRHNQNIWVDLGDGRGPWLNTGDLGRMDAEGYFWLTGRKKELIIRGGHNIDPKTIEDPMHRHPAVAIAAAVGRPDARVGELPVVYVQLNPGAEATPAALLAFAQETVPERAAIPKQIIIIEQMPVTAVGKIFKPALVRMQIEDVLGAALNRLPEVAEARVQAVPSKLHGVEVTISILLAVDADRAAGEKAVQDVLGQYAFHYVVTIESQK